MRAESVIILFALTCATVRGQVTASSIAELVPYLDTNDTNVVMTPGVYRIGPAEVSSGLLPNPTLLEFTGSNSVFDFTDVTIEVDTDIFRSFGNTSVTEIALTGSNLVVKNLRLTDIGSTPPRRTALGVLLDGFSNRVEGFHMTVRGSFPYAYGDIFGKGSGYVIKHYKHSAVLVRGNNSHLKDCVIIHRAYGHGIFCQGSVDATIEGCYVEGEMRTTDEVLAEEGTGSPADLKNFNSVWGYRVPPGWTFSLQEDGIRAYNAGVDQNGSERNTRNLRVIDCTVKNMRSGVTIGFCDDEKYVQGCVVLGCENGYWVGSGGQVVNSAGNAQFGPLYENNYQNDSNSEAELTLLDNEDEYGNQIVAYIGGSNHKLTFHSSDESPDPNLKIMVAGVRKGLRFHEINPTYNDFSTNNVELENLTKYPIVLAAKSANTTGESGGSVLDQGNDNSIALSTEVQLGGFAILQPIEASKLSAHFGLTLTIEAPGVILLDQIDDGDWIRFDNVFLGVGPNRFEAQIASNGFVGDVDIRLDAPDGPRLGTCHINKIAGLQTWLTDRSKITNQRGLHDLYLVFQGSSSHELKLSSIKLSLSSTKESEQPLVSPILDHSQTSSSLTLNWTAQEQVEYELLRSFDLKTWSRDPQPFWVEGSTQTVSIKKSSLKGPAFYRIKPTL